MQSKETKPGLQTTEFWLQILLQILLTLNTVGIWDYLPPRYSTFAQAILGAAYALSRGWAKSGVSVDGGGTVVQPTGTIEVNTEPAEPTSTV